MKDARNSDAPVTVMPLTIRPRSKGHEQLLKKEWTFVERNF